MAQSSLGECSVRLIEQHSQFANCTAGITFGCAGPQQMWATRGCRGNFECGNGFKVYCEGPWEGKLKCSCVSCYKTNHHERDGGMRGLHCCSDNGAALSHGDWDPASPGNADAVSCRDLCARTPSCMYASFSSAPPTCADDLRKVSAGFGRCSLCAACTSRARGWSWHASYTSYEVAAPQLPPNRWPHPSSASSSVAPPAPRSRPHARPSRPTPIPALIISGCDARYQRAAAIARSAGLNPSWLVGVFPENTHPSLQWRGCKWPTPAERNLLAAHRNAWSCANSGVAMAVLEDDIELMTSAHAVHDDVRRCEATRQQQQQQEQQQQEQQHVSSSSKSSSSE